MNDKSNNSYDKSRTILSLSYNGIIFTIPITTITQKQEVAVILSSFIIAYIFPTKSLGTFLQVCVFIAYNN